MLLPHIVVGTARRGDNFESVVDVVSLQDSLELKSVIAQPVTLWTQQADKTYRPCTVTYTLHDDWELTGDWSACN
ncbi:hypothetical protein WL76_29115 [Burkholderia ubonensis]|nr:hypothetical protein WL76_29115 [Burkholderia ubonensis]